MNLTGKKFLLLLLYTPFNGEYNYPIKGRTRLTKLVFLFEREIKKKFSKGIFEEIRLPEFFSYDFGPFSSELYDDLEFLINRGYIQSLKTDDTPLFEEVQEFIYWADISVNEVEYSEEKFSLTEKGIIKSKEMWKELNVSQTDSLINFKEVYMRLSLTRMLEYVYTKYPDYTNKSIIKDKILS